MKYILVTDGTWGDTLPFMFLAKEMLRHGHTVTVYANAFYADYAQTHGIPFVVTTSLDNRKTFLEHPDLWDHKKGMNVIGHYAGIMFTKTYSIIEDAINTNGKPDMIIAHSFSYAAKTIAEKYSIAYACLLISPIQLRSNYRLPVFYGGKDINYIPTFIKKLIYPLVDRFIIDPAFNRLINRYRKKLGLEKIRGFVHWSTWAPLTIGLWPEWYSPLMPDQKNYARLAGFPDQVEIDTSTDPELTTWIKTGPKPILVTMGSGYLFAEDLIKKLKTLTNNTPHRILFIGPHQEKTDPHQEPTTKIKIIGHTQLSTILPLCAAIIYHGGAGTLAQAVRAGIPQILIPQSHDQPDNAAHIAKHHLGEVIWQQNPDLETLKNTLTRVLSDESIQQHCAAAATKMRSQHQSGIANAYSLITEFLPHSPLESGHQVHQA